MDRDNRQEETELADGPRLQEDEAGVDGASSTGGHEEGDDPLEELRAELEEARDRQLRLAAEFENYRKRTRQELGRSGERAQAALVGSLLDVVDDIDRFADQDPAAVSIDSLLEGIGMVRRKLDRVLEEAGVEVVEAHDAPFDPETMEAVVRVPATDPREDDRVAQVLQKGVLFKGHLVRPARVAVKKAD